jgi:hypothetical protein
MKTIATILLILNLNFVYGQKVQDKKEFDKKITELYDTVKQLKQQVQILTDKQEWKNQILEERLKQASETISSQNSLFDGFGVLYAIITVVIALIAIALPILTYQFGIKPSQEALKEFENNAEKKMEEFLFKTRNIQIEQAIENLKSQNQELKTNALAFLSLTQHQGFTDQQLYKLFLLLKSNDIDQAIKGTIAFTISNRKSDYATDYFSTALKDPKNTNIKYAAIRYFTSIGIENYIHIFRDLISDSKDKNTEFITLLGYIFGVNRNSLVTILNDKELIDKLDKNAINSLKLSLPTLKTTWQLSDNEVEQSYLNEKLKNASS